MNTICTTSSGRMTTNRRISCQKQIYCRCIIGSLKFMYLILMDSCIKQYRCSVHDSGQDMNPESSYGTMIQITITSIQLHVIEDPITLLFQYCHTIFWGKNILSIYEFLKWMTMSQSNACVIFMWCYAHVCCSQSTVSLLDI